MHGAATKEVSLVISELAWPTWPKTGEVGLASREIGLADFEQAASSF